LLGLQMMDHLARGNWLAFAFDSYRQVLWPPLYAWLLGLQFLIFGASRASGRAFSLLAYVALALALFALGRETALDPQNATDDAGRTARRAIWCGLIAATIGIVAPLTRGLAAAMRPEALSAVLLVAGMWACLRAGRSARAGPWVLVGVLIVLTYLARVQYSLILLAAVALDRLIAARLRPRALFTRANLAWIAPPVLFALLWLSYPPKALAAVRWLGAAVNYRLGPQWPGVANALYYPLALPDASGSWLVALYLVTGALFSLRYLERRALRFNVLVALLQLVPSLFSENHQMRLMLPLLLALAAPAGYWIVAGFELFTAQRSRLAGPVAVGVAAVLLLGFGAPTGRLDLDPVAPAPLDPLLAYVAAQARAASPVLLLVGPAGGRGGDYWLLDWHALAEARLIPINGSGVLYPPWSSARLAPVDALARLGAPPALVAELERLNARGVVPDPPGSGRALWLELSIDAPHPTTPAALREVLAPTLAAYQPRRIVALGHDARRALHPDFVRGARRRGYAPAEQRVSTTCASRCSCSTRRRGGRSGAPTPVRPPSVGPPA
jgi:4-amino-4-deoxy-L-arabinose transferase-like glycosyltransferase